MSIQPRLPIEVLEAVIDEASNNPVSLHQLSLTCITLLPRSRVRLFSGLVIRTVQQLEESRVFLDSRPWLLPLVQKVTISIFIPHDNTKPNIRLLDVFPIHLFTRLPNLRAWTMETEVLRTGRPSLSLHHSALRCYRIYGGHIDSLELSSIRFRNKSDFRGLISAFTSLDSLTCYGIQFHSSKQQPVIAATVPTNIRPLPISTLNISTSMDSWALEYLLACSASRLKHLIIQLRGQDSSSRSLEQFKQLLTQLPPLSSLVLVISLLEGLSMVDDDNLSTTIHFATTILEHVNRDHLMNVRVEFRAYPLAKLGAPLSEASALLKACKQLETALLTFSKAPVLVHDPVYDRRAGRAKFWSPTIRRTFPKLDERGLLILKFTPSKEDAPDPVGHEDQVTSIVVSHDSTRAVTSSEDGTIIVWDIAGGAVLHEWVAHQGSPVEALALSPDSIRLVSSDRHALAVWDMGDGSPIKAAELEGHTREIDACAWSPDGVLIASASYDQTVRIWDGHTYAQRGRVPAYPHPHSELRAASSLRFSPDSSYIAWITCGRDCHIWRPLMGEQPKILPLHLDGGDKVYTTVFSFDLESRHIATAHEDHNNDPDAYVVRIWDAATVTPIAVLARHSKPVQSILFSPDGRSLLSVDMDMSMWIWDCGTWSGKQTDGFRDSESRVWHRLLCVRPDGKYVATVSSNRLVQLWSTSDGECVATLDDRNTFVNCVMFSPNGKFLVTGYHDGIVRIYCLSRFIGE